MPRMMEVCNRETERVRETDDTATGRVNYPTVKIERKRNRESKRDRDRERHREREIKGDKERQRK